MINIRLSPVGLLCWPNIFLSLLFVFHLGYYIPAKLGIIEEPSLLINIYDPAIPLALTIFGLAMLSFELASIGTLYVTLQGHHCKNASSKRIVRYKPIRLLGLSIASVGIVFFIIYIIQLGGVDRLFTMSYGDYYAFLNTKDPRFTSISVNYLPIGLLLLFIGSTDLTNKNRRITARLVIAGILAFSAWLLWIGNRGMALLLLLCFIYIKHIWIKKIPTRQIIIFIMVGLLSISVVGQLRNIAVSDRNMYVADISIRPLDAITEMGGTLRSYMGFVTMFSSGGLPQLGIKPYLMAFTRLIPNLGAGTRANVSASYYRSNVWITELLDPVTAKEGGGLGSSGVGEPYASFGIWGVLAIFLILGFSITKIEIHSILFRSPYLIALIAFIFIPLNWYIRDDIYGTVRPLVWGILAILITYIFAHHPLDLRILRRRVGSKNNNFAN